VLKLTKVDINFQQMLKTIHIKTALYKLKSEYFGNHAPSIIRSRLQRI